MCAERVGQEETSQATLQEKYQETQRIEEVVIVVVGGYHIGSNDKTLVLIASIKMQQIRAQDLCGGPECVTKGNATDTCPEGQENVRFQKC